MERNLIGRFYFRQTNNGNLIGEFSSNQDESIYTESADKISTQETSSSNFIGSYLSTWRLNKKATYSTLIIDFKPGSKNHIYSLSWEDNGKCIYRGEGMLCGDILIGDYRNFECESE